MNAIELSDVCKRYLLEYRGRLSLKKKFINSIRHKEFWALKGINLDIPEGQTLGIIGKNGAGKTTLLKLLSGVTKPTKGSIKIKGRVAGLLELGAGFQGDLTGRENIYLNGSILGLSRKDIQENINSIIEFADIGDFIDAPVRTYSAGMYLRLGFSITTLLNSDVLLIDEVLSIGDTKFQKKCINKINEFKKYGKTIIFVSHDLNILREICEKIVIMDKGCIMDYADPNEAIRNYLSFIDKSKIFYISKEIEITNVYFKNGKGEVLNNFKTGEELEIIIEYLAHKKIKNPVFGIGIYRDDIYLLGPNTRDHNFKIDCAEGKGEIRFKMHIPFTPGKYKVSITSHNLEETVYYDYHDKCYEFEVRKTEKDANYGLFNIKGKWS